MLRKIGWLSVFLLQGPVYAQIPGFTRQDTLRGTITPERSWWDLTYYHLKITVNPQDSSLHGSTVVHYRVVDPHGQMQIDLQPPLAIDKVVQDGETLAFRQEGTVWLIDLVRPQAAGSSGAVEIFYSGRPRIAVRPPWDGGVQWERDAGGRPWVATSCQGVGASAWWPCKDHMYDEPDSMLISVTVPAGLANISNGRLRSAEKHDDGATTFHWFVASPINNYGVNINVGNYTGWKEVYQGENGPLDISYYVLPENLEKAKAHFMQVPGMLQAFEYWFGPYPFYADGFKLVEVPYLGMEHQSSVTYGNRFKNGYLGRDLSGTGWGLRFDFIIIHESGHEWFANNITYRDIADMWVHESFTTYSESLYLEYHYGKQAAAEYIRGTRGMIQNEARIMGIFGVNQRGSGDMYAKGSNMLHTIRQIINDDEKWRQILRGLNRTFYHSTVEGEDIRRYISRESGKDLTAVFKQYLEDVRVPVLEYGFKAGALYYRWGNVLEGFEMPVKIQLPGGAPFFITPSGNWKKLRTSAEELIVDPDFYVGSREVTSF